MASAMCENPVPFVYNLTGKVVIVKLKWGMEYKGYLVSADEFLNLHLVNTEEYIDGNCTGNFGEIIVRHNNVLHIRGVDEDEEKAVQLNSDSSEEGEVKSEESEVKSQDDTRET